jgi:hypothetical protein
MHWSGETDRLDEYQLGLHKRQLARQTEKELLRSYATCLRSLQLDEGSPPSAAKIQYFVETWRELRRRRRQSK